MGGARVEAKDFGWHHPGRHSPAVSGLSLVIEPGQKVLLLGPSGAGKSTFLHALAGVIHDDDGETALGELLVDGVPAEDSHGTVGMMQQDPESSVILAKVGDDVAFGPENLQVPRNEIWPRVRASLDAVGLGELLLEHSTSALSGGQKQRLGLAGILAMQPRVLLLDEPTANLDPEGVLEVRDAVIAAQRTIGATMIVIEHRVSVWAQFMDRVIVLSPGGGISHDGSPDQVLVDARDELIAAGVWVPDYSPQASTAHRASDNGAGAGAELLRGRALAVTREQPTRKMMRVRKKLARSPEPVSLPLPLRPVTDGIDVSVNAGEHLSIMGVNGAGKSTLALTLAGLQLAANGILYATDELRDSAHWDVASWSPEELVSRIGLVFQEPEHQFLTANVRAELEFGPRQVAKARKQAVDEEDLAQRTEALMRRLRLDHVADANPFTLSGGEKRRLSVATALATAPRILILDEPTFGQDANTWAELVNLLHELMTQGTAVVSVTHDLDFVEALGGRTLYLGAHS